ncbi:MAG: S8 family serine peptidase [Anaerolineae bacterium]|nr:S8 family serine peptidase [Anaerolineae bacterium]
MNKRTLRWVLISVTAVVLIAAAVTAGILVLDRQGGVLPTPMPTFAPLAISLIPPLSLQDMATQVPRLAGILADPELNSAYKDFLLAYQQDGIEGAAELAHRRGLLTPEDELRATLILDTADNAEVVEQLESIGVIVESAYKSQVDIAVPLTLIEQTAASEDPGAIFARLTALEHVIRVKLPSKTRTGALPSIPPSVISQGVRVIGADKWHKEGYAGAGIRIGILDCGFRGYAELLGTELPAAVQAQTFVRGLADVNDSGTRHGTAVAEIIHEIVSEATLYLADYGCRSTAQGQAVEWLLEQDVHIISNSTGSLAAPMDGSGWHAQLAQMAADQGVLWVNSAGNAAQTHYRGEFADADSDGYHEFDVGLEGMAFTSGAPYVEISLRWNDWALVDQDYDLLLVDADGNKLAWARDAQTGSPGEEPIEILEYEGLVPGDVYYLAIYADDASRSVLFDLMVYGEDIVIEFPVPEYSLVSPADARDALAVGAVLWKSDQVTGYSSRGPTADERPKPDISAPTEVDSASYGRFGGTSAAAPHVAGAAALVWGAYPDLTRQQVWDYLTSNAVDLGPPGADSAYGIGRVYLPMAQPITPTPEPTATPIPPPSTPTGTPTETAVSPVATDTPAATPVSSVPTNTPGVAKVVSPTAAVAVVPTATRTPIPFVPGVPTPSDPIAERRVAAGLAIGLCSGLVAIVALAAIAYAVISRLRQSPEAPAPPFQPPRRPQYPTPGAQAPPRPVPRRPQHPPPGAQAPPRLAPRGPQRLPPDYQPPSVLACPHCGRPTRAGALFCSECGMSLSPPTPGGTAASPDARCRQCGATLRAGARFCARCGARQ